MIPLKIEDYTFQEILNVFPTHAPEYPHDSSMDAEWFTKYLADIGMNYNVFGLSSEITAVEIKKLVNAVMTMVYDRHAYDYVHKYVSEITEPDHTLNSDDVDKVFYKILNILDLTLPKYIPLFKEFEKASSDPIAPIKSESSGETRFNDTPQNIGDFGDEDHTTNISNSKSESSVDTGSLMERLSALYKDFRSIILEWSNEFNQLFLKEEQLV